MLDHIENFEQPIPLNGYDSYQSMVDAAKNPDLKVREHFWSDVATQLLDWDNSEFSNIIGEIGNPNSFWFDGGYLNVCYNAVDRHAMKDPNRVALIYEGNDPSEQYNITYGELKDRVSRLANVLKSFGINKGSCVSIYLPVSCEAIITMLACARIGAIHSLIFGAFRGDALRYRINDCHPTVVVTADGYYRSSKALKMKCNLDEVINDCPDVKNVLVFSLINDSCPMISPRDIYVQTLIEKASNDCPCIPIKASDPLFYLYTSGSTGNPKGIIHRAGGYSVAAALTHRFVFSIKPGDRFGCTSDLGWITGHTYVCYGPLLNGVSTLIFGGLPLYPDSRRPWQLINKLGLTHFYTSPSAARAISANFHEDVDKIDTSSLRVIGSVGEPLDETTWNFLFEKLGRKKCWIVDTYWQTEMGSIIATAIPGHHPGMGPGKVGRPLFGTELVLLDPIDHSVLARTNSHAGPIVDALLCIASPWPGLANDTITKQINFRDQYIVPGTNFFSTGDLACVDEEGLVRISGRTDDQLCVNGHRVGPAEVEAVIMEHSKVDEAAVIGIPHPLSGQSIVAFVVSQTKTQELANEIKLLVSAKFSAIGRPSRIYIVDDLPKTRSEKIIRMLLRAILTKDDLRDPPTIKNPQCISHLKEVVQKGFF